MPQLLVMELPKGPRGDVVVMRHYLTFEDGRIFYQDEYIGSRREDWIQLPTPPMIGRVVGLTTYNGCPMALHENGKSFLWAAKPTTTADEEMQFATLVKTNQVYLWPHQWVEFAEPVPETAARVAYES